MQLENKIHEWYEKFDETNRSELDDFIRYLLPLFEPKPGGRFLDIGCYDGTNTIFLARHIRAQVYGVDFLDKRLEEAKSKGIIAIRCDLNREKLPFPDAFFDTVYCGDIIEHLFSPDELLTEIRRVLKTDGYAVISTPNLASWRCRISILLGWQPLHVDVSTRYRVGNPRHPKSRPPGHIRVFSLRALTDLVKLYGFKVVRIKGGYSCSRPQDLTEHLTRAVDRMVSYLRPTLCERIAIKIYKDV